MDLNKQIIDQRIRQIVSDKTEWFGDDENRNISKSFLLLSIASCLEMDISEAYNCITDGGGDAGIDGLYIGDTNDYEFPVVLFQSKYHFNLEKEYNFPDNAVQKLINTVGVLFNPNRDVQLNPLLKPKINEIRSLIMDGYFPTVKCILTNNGEKWQQEGEQHITNANFPKNQVSFEHYNHLDISKQLYSSEPINDSLTLTGKAVIEDFDFKRVLIGAVSVTELGSLMQRYGDALLEKNIRKFLGLNKNRVNQSIKNTLLDKDKRKNFYFFNNGITLLTSKFSYNALMDENWQLKIEGLQIINGGQTSKTILNVVNEHPEIDFSNTKVLLRLYEVSSEDDTTNKLTTDITIATNSQTPVDLRDLRANDSKQQELAIAIGQLKYEYLTKKGTGTSKTTSQTIPSSVASEAIFSIWKKKPHIAKYKKRELFGRFYEEVFSDINGAQIITAVLIHRYCDSNRKKIELINEYRHIPYSNYFVAMICGYLLLKQSEISLQELTHLNFSEINDYWNNTKEGIYKSAIKTIHDQLLQIFPTGIDEIDPRTLAATFRRGDLLERLNGS